MVYYRKIIKTSTFLCYKNYSYMGNKITLQLASNLSLLNHLEKLCPVPVTKQVKTQLKCQ